MLKIKAIKKEGKYLTIIIKKPKFKNYKKFIMENKLIFEDTEYAVLEPKITLLGDIELNFILRNYDDIKPYINLVEKVSDDNE